MYIKGSKLFSVLLLITVTISAVFSNSQSALASSIYSEQDVGTAIISSVRHIIHNDIPEPREISGNRNPSSAVIYAMRKSGHNPFRSSDHSSDDGYIVCGDPTISAECFIFFYHLSTHPGDMIIQYIHDQDGEKDRAFL